MDKINKKMVIILVVFVAILVFILHFRPKKSDDKITLVNDGSTFFTVSACVSKYINYLSTNDTEELLILLDNKYKKKYNIDSENINNYLFGLSGNYTFKGKKMYSQKVGKSRYKYYVYGVITKDIINTVSEEEDFYLIVYLNEKNMTFSIEPYDGEIFNN